MSRITVKQIEEHVMAQSSWHIKLTMTSSHLSSSGILSAPLGSCHFHIKLQSYGSYSTSSLLSDLINSSIQAFLVICPLTSFNADLQLLVSWITKVTLLIFPFIHSSSNSFSHLLNFLNLLSDFIFHLQSTSSKFISQEPFYISSYILPVHIRSRTVFVPHLLTSVQVLIYVLFLPSGMPFYISVHSTPPPSFESVSHLCSVFTVTSCKKLSQISPGEHNFFFKLLWQSSVLFCYSCLQMIISSRLLKLSVQTDSSGICFLWW